MAQRQHTVRYLSDEPATSVRDVEEVFWNRRERLTRPAIARVTDVLDVIRPDLVGLGWTVATGQRSTAGVPLRSAGDWVVRADAEHPSGTALWIETGRSWTNFAFGQHILESLMAPEVRNIVVAVVETYKGQPTFQNCRTFLDDLFRSSRIEWPFDSMTLIGF